MLSQARHIRQLIRLAGQHASVDDILTRAENLILSGRLAVKSRQAARVGMDVSSRQSGLPGSGWQISQRVLCQVTGGAKASSVPCMSGPAMRDACAEPRGEPRLGDCVDGGFGAGVPGAELGPAQPGAHPAWSLDEHERGTAAEGAHGGLIFPFRAEEVPVSGNPLSRTEFLVRVWPSRRSRPYPRPPGRSCRPRCETPVRPGSWPSRGRTPQRR